MWTLRRSRGTKVSGSWSEDERRIDGGKSGGGCVAGLGLEGFDERDISSVGRCSAITSSSAVSTGYSTSDQTCGRDLVVFETLGSGFVQLSADLGVFLSFIPVSSSSALSISSSASSETLSSSIGLCGIVTPSLKNWGGIRGNREPSIYQVAGEFRLRILIGVLPIEVCCPNERAFLLVISATIWRTVCKPYLRRRVVPRIEGGYAGFEVGSVGSIAMMIPQLHR